LSIVGIAKITISDSKVGIIMNKMIRVSSVMTAVIAISLTGTTVSLAAEAQTPVVKKIAFTAEQKAAFQGARAEFKAAREARQVAIAAAKAAIATAKSNFDAAKAAATTREDRQAARAAFKAAVTAAIASVPAKPTKPVRP
jgi:hypothetical protein